MGSKYKIRDKDGLYFVTFTVVRWVDLFIRNSYRECLLESFRYCIENKGLRLHAYCIMTSHLHAILSSDEDLVSIIRDFKKFTSKRLIELIKEVPESRLEWMLNKFSYEAQRRKRGKSYILWQEGYHAKQIETNQFLDEKLGYIHNNPVEGGFVELAEEFVFSSAKNYCGEQGFFEVELLM